MAKWVYGFDAGRAEGRAEMRDLLGGKGANLAEMSNLGLPVPPGFTITTEVCTWFYRNNRSYPPKLKQDVDTALKHVGEVVDARFGDANQPLLVSVRSGARASMPGMMDTVLNLGLNDKTVRGLAKQTGDERFAYDAYRRFIQMYSGVVLEIEHARLEEILEAEKANKGVELDTELDAADWKRIAGLFKAEVQKLLGRRFPDDVHEQLWGAIGAVFGSWSGARAKTYRRIHNIPEDWGTAVNVQAMVFGNRGETSCTGVAFTRDPSTGENALYGEFLINAQGEDVVAGIRTPQSITRRAREASRSQRPSMEEAMPEAFAELRGIAAGLEKHYRDMQDMEFTVQEGRLYMLQTRTGKRTAKAALRIATDMAREGMITRDEALMRIDPASLDQMLHPMLDPTASRELIATGLAASPGSAAGEIVFSADDAERAAANGHEVILVRLETSPEDIHGMHAAKGILTIRGGMTSHAAVVARGMGRPCVTGAGTLRIDPARGLLIAGNVTLARGDLITIDGAEGRVYRGRVPMIHPEMTAEFALLMEWADARRRLKVHTNADTPLDCETAKKFGAEGVGLCRTEHMFFDADRILAVREMILADDLAGRQSALAKLLPMQRGDFLGIFRVMEDRPVTIRLLDPPLHEFIPHTDDEIAEVARAAGADPQKLRARAIALSEANPMLGHRGCRLGITYPEIYEMQARAIFEAAIQAETETGKPVHLEVMIPLVGFATELDFLAQRIAGVADLVARERQKKPEYLIGTMIELPRAALMAERLAQTAEFFSFGTNDLTQTTLGVSRDDAGSFLGEYLARGVLAQDPFVSIDIDGVGELVRIAVERGRRGRADIKLGICGEHGGDPATIHFCHETGLDYVSCSPFRVPVARLAAAQAAINKR
ncbi:MAG: pyruvate, phosphate dikinase [Alphaproteobacteria bacterium]|nr:pyruvate, phosphate dikinase [Alphaproteobacteria bacterium]